MASERTIFSISEEQVTGQTLISSNDLPYVRLEARAVENAMEYSVKGATPLGSDSVASILETPIHQQTASWQEVQRGLQGIGHPSRWILAISRSAMQASELRDIQGATQEVSDILANTHDSWTKTEHIPVFSYSEAQKYATTTLFEHTSEKQLLLMLKEAGLDSQRAEQLYRIIAHVMQPRSAVQELEAITGIGLTEHTTAQIQAMLSEVDDRYITEVIHRLQNNLFRGFEERAHVEEGLLVGGSDKLSALIRRSDIPSNLPSGYTNVRIDNPQVKIASEGKLHDAHKNAGYERRIVTFHTQMERPVVLPKLVWRTTGKETRIFAFPVSTFEDQKKGLARPSSLIGAAIVAQTIGREAGVDYQAALRERIGHKLIHRRSISGLWPLVAVHQQEVIFKNSYFEAIENKLQ